MTSLIALAPDSKKLTQHRPPRHSLFAARQDYGCFACGTDTGFRIYNVEPFRETFRRDFTSGGIGIVEVSFAFTIVMLRPVSL